MINPVYHDKPLIFMRGGAMFQGKLVSHHQAVNEADCSLLTRHVGSKRGTNTDSFPPGDWIQDKRSRNARA